MKTTNDQTTISARRIAATRFPELTAAVLASVDADSLPDVVNHGASGGFGSFIYYSDTLAFFDANRADIMGLAKELAAELGEGCALAWFALEEVARELCPDA